MAPFFYFNSRNILRLVLNRDISYFAKLNYAGYYNQGCNPNLLQIFGRCKYFLINIMQMDIRNNLTNIKSRTFHLLPTSQFIGRSIFFSFMVSKSAYLIFVIFFTLAKFLENKIYTEKRQFFALNL